jgi:retinol dehydrogenase 12
LRLDAIIANAGVEMIEFTMAEGVETTLLVNVVSTMLLNIAVLPKLRETSAEHNTITTITAVGSSVHIFGATESLVQPTKGSGIDIFDLLSDPVTADMGKPGVPMSPRYALSKTILHGVLPQLAARASRPGHEEQVIVNCVNPGWCASEIARNKPSPAFMQNLMFALIGRTTEQGSRTLVHGIFAGPESNGQYLSECRVLPESDFLRSEKGNEVRKWLWEELIARIEKISPETAGFLE